MRKNTTLLTDRFMAGYNFFIYEALLIPFEITALSTVLNFWSDDIPGWAIPLACIVSLRGFQSLSPWLTQIADSLWVSSPVRQSPKATTPPSDTTTLLQPKRLFSLFIPSAFFLCLPSDSDSFFYPQATLVPVRCSDSLPHAPRFCSTVGDPSTPARFLLLSLSACVSVPRVLAHRCNSLVFFAFSSMSLLTLVFH
jgi:hypothetical protein